MVSYMMLINKACVHIKIILHGHENAVQPQSLEKVKNCKRCVKKII